MSASGYTGGASNCAAAKDIEFQTTEELDPTTVLSWIGVAEISILRACCDHSLEVEVYGDR